MFRHNISRNTIRKIIKISCVFQFVNAFMDYLLWMTVGYHVPSWAIATLVAGYSVLLLSYDRLIS